MSISQQRDPGEESIAIFGENMGMAHRGKQHFEDINGFEPDGVHSVNSDIEGHHYDKVYFTGNVCKIWEMMEMMEVADEVVWAITSEDFVHNS